MSLKVTVIIPYYQSQKGILRKAVSSALNQQMMESIEVVVIDDLSPVPAGDELAILERCDAHRITKIQQEKKGGPGAARNSGLDVVDENTEYVAFLDSDDQWSADHLSRATSALEKGYDFYFSDFFQLNQTVSAFDRAKRISLSDHRKLDVGSSLYEYSGDMFNQILTGNIIGTSTVVYRFSKFRSLRFRTEYRYAGEDYLFWLEICRLTNKIAFSSQRECVYGHGVNVYSGSGWGSDTALECIHDDMKYRQFVIDKMKPSQEQIDALSNKFIELRHTFIRSVFHNLLQGKVVHKDVLWAQLRLDPRSLLALVPILAETCLAAFRRVSSGFRNRKSRW